MRINIQTQRMIRVAARREGTTPEKWLHDILELLKEHPEEMIELLKRKKEEQKALEKQIVYEEITMQVPKLIMDFLREHEKDMGMTAKEYIEYNVIGTVRADIDAGDVFYPAAKEIAKNWNLNPIFKVVLNDPVTI